jgi:hypothetical protein
MIMAFDGLVELAKREGQTVQELGYSMANLFIELATNGEYRPTEEMIVSNKLSSQSVFVARKQQDIDVRTHDAQVFQF